MDDNRANRPWFCWSAITWLVLLTTTGALINVNLDAGDDGRVQLLPPPPREHGWPQPFLVRMTALTSPTGGPYRLAMDFGQDISLSTGSSPPPSRWPFDSPPVTLFSRRMLMFDVTIGLVIIILAGVAIERWSRRRTNCDQFSLKMLLTVVAWTASCVTLAMQLALRWDSIVYHVSVAVLVISIGLAWAGCLDCLGLALGKAVGARRRERPARQVD